MFNSAELQTLLSGSEAEIDVKYATPERPFICWPKRIIKTEESLVSMHRFSLFNELTRYVFISDWQSHSSYHGFTGPDDPVLKM